MQYVLSVMSSDHPGIVAGVGTAVQELGGNILSCSQTVLGGYFTFITIIELPGEYRSEELAQRIQQSEGLGSGYQIMVSPYEPKSELERNRPQSEIFVITAFGKDRPGIVKEFSRFLAGHDINIIDLYGEQRAEDFILIGQLIIPPTVNVSSLQDDLKEMGAEFGFAVKLQHNNIFVATNQLRLADEIVV